MSTGQRVQAVNVRNLTRLVLSAPIYQTILTNLIGQPVIQIGANSYYTVSQILAASPQNITVPTTEIESIPSPVNCCTIQPTNTTATTVSAGNQTTPAQTTSVVFPESDLTYLQFARPGLFGSF
jgi:hypothetical protein